MSATRTDSVPPMIAPFFAEDKRGNILWSGNVFKKNRSMKNDPRMMVVTDTGIFLFNKASLRRSIKIDSVRALVDTGPQRDKLAVVQIVDQHDVFVESTNTSEMLDAIRTAYRGHFGSEIEETQVHDTEKLIEKVQHKKKNNWVNNPNDGLVVTENSAVPQPSGAASAPPATTQEFPQGSPYVVPPPTSPSNRVTFDDNPDTTIDRPASSHHKSDIPGPSTPPLETIDRPTSGLLGTEIPPASPMVISARKGDSPSFGRGRGVVNAYPSPGYEDPGYQSAGRGRGRGNAYVMSNVNAMNAHVLRQKGSSLMSPRRPQIMPVEEGSWISLSQPPPPLQSSYIPQHQAMVAQPYSPPVSQPYPQPQGPVPIWAGQQQHQHQHQHQHQPSLPYHPSSPGVLASHPAPVGGLTSGVVIV